MNYESLNNKALKDFAKKVEGIDGLEVTETGIRMKTNYGTFLFTSEVEESMNLVPGRKYKTTGDIIYSQVFDIYGGEGDTEGKELLDEYLADGFKISADGEYVIIPAGTVMEYFESDYTDGFKLNGNEYDFCDIDEILDILEAC